MNIDCPLPADTGEIVRLGHGSGGELSQRLLRDCVFPHFNNSWIAQGHDSATLPPATGQVVFTTDSFVVTPLFFPGGDIGRLAVYGTVNDLAMSGARPLYLSCSLILEEGLPLDTLTRVMSSMGAAATRCGVQLVTGDTKVVERGKGDGIYINTAGIGVLHESFTIEPGQIRPGDVILLSGDIGRHGMAVMARREGLEFDSPLQSDCAPLHRPVQNLLDAGISIHCLRDLTRGGLATALVELAETAGREFLVREADIPTCDAVRGACEMLGLDPLYVANEGRFIAFVPADQVESALAVLESDPVTVGSRAIGTVTGGDRQQVILQNALGCERLLHRLPGEQLPRIC
ncbi:hydrogenase expression/formation protein HypE [Microbulbifer sp. YPW16]|uniref:hydrogenase expression/formation protein HypE n=1 Tax=Microbulbifer sp. YPW16 TaxID=2904242 RepID=UPI001E41BA50|nr:hydrogenase expression/formation protein HypE [Microbulbifer sp. YPW16]UHQ55682.1 hydrogenase expression/formation protein HypE [Microbulbifer sp. YPW16]